MAGAGMVALSAGAISEGDLQEAALAGDLSRSEAYAWGSGVNVAYGLGYVLMAGGVTVGGVGLTLSGGRPTMAVSWSGRW